MMVYKTPSGPGTCITANDKEKTNLTVLEQGKFRSGVGILLYIIKHSRPDIANATRELSKVMDNATRGHYKSLLRTIKFVEDTRTKVLIMKPTDIKDDNWEIKAFCDSNYAGDKVTRKCITDFLIYVKGCLVSWKSHAQRCVTLSSTEAEYVVVSEQIQIQPIQGLSMLISGIIL